MSSPSAIARRPSAASASSTGCGARASPDRSSPTTTSNARRPTRASGCSPAATCRSSSSAARSTPTPSVILANQPTRGLDVGAVSYVHARLLEARARGAAILLISEDLEEVLALADRVVVISKGRLSAPSARGERSIRDLGELMAGGRGSRHEGSSRERCALRRPPLSCRTSPPRGGRSISSPSSAGTSPTVRQERREGAGAPDLPPCVGEMSGRSEGKQRSGVRSATTARRRLIPGGDVPQTLSARPMHAETTHAA